MSNLALCHGAAADRWARWVAKKKHTKLPKLKGLRGCCMRGHLIDQAKTALQQAKWGDQSCEVIRLLVTCKGGVENLLDAQICTVYIIHLILWHLLIHKANNWDERLAASCNNRSLKCTTPNWTSLPGTPLVVHPSHRQRQKKRNCSHVSTTKAYSHAF